MSTATTTALSDHIRELAKARKDVAERDAAIKAARVAFEATLDLEGLKNAKAVEALHDAEVRALTLAAHKVDPTNTKPSAGVSVVMETKCSVNEADGLAWAIEKQMCLIPQSLDTKAAIAIAKASKDGLPFVTITEVPAVRIAGDLEKVLGAE